MMINLYQKIIEILEENDKTIKDICWVGTEKATIDRARFIEVSKNIEYDTWWNGASDLIIVGVDWWLSRAKCDCYGWWAFYTLPQRPKIQKTKFDLAGDSLFE